MDRLGSADVLLFEGFRFDRGSGDLLRLDEAGIAAPVPIGSRALGLLRLLVERPGELISKDAIMEAVWPRMVVEEGNLTVQISALRRILDQDRVQGSCIQTVPGRGYRFVAPVTPVERAASPASAPSSANGSDGPIAENEQAQGPGAPEQIGRTGPTRTPRGRHRLWGGSMATVIGALVLAAAVVAWNWHLLWSGDARPAPRLSIVVLPFTNLSDDREQQYFADGITDDVTIDLSRISNSFVIARNTAFTYREKPVDVKQLGRELGVRYVIEGSVRRLGDQVQVNVLLVDAESGSHVWADRFDTDRQNLAEAQSEITGRLARTLNAQLIEAVSRRIERERTADPDARDLVMRGWARFYSGPPTAATSEEAIGFFERALEIDQGSVEAKIGIASTLDGRLSPGWSSSAKEDEARVERLLQEALDRDPNNPRAHLSKGVLRQVQNRLAEAQIELETAIALDRNNPVAFRGLGATLMLLGRPEAAIPYIEKSIRLSPHDPRIVFNFSVLGQCHLLLGHVDHAIELLKKARGADPRFFGIHLSLAGALGLRGDLDEARAEVAEAIKLKPEINSLAAWRAASPWGSNPEYSALRDKTLVVGLRRAGFPEE
jgi:TolB-like protein/DNA-binding winged helix-turn-helix (wHTH) protein/tetratricopeptide (TPR) repeat protein